jgi:cytoskeletal protein CcmA (bactofilin family)
MALFNKEPENNSRSENPHETPPVPVPSTSQSLVSENVGPAHHASSAEREVGVVIRKPADMRAYLDSRTKINGKLNFEGPVQIDGHVEGEIVAREHLVIGEGAQVMAKIKAGSVVVAGVVNGEIIATERIEIRASARISGNLAAPRVVMHEGALFEGHCTMKLEEVPVQTKPPVLRTEEQMKARAAAQNGT